MCGIIAIAGKRVPADVSDALDTLALRGPEDSGTITFPHCTIAQTRLSIIDLAGGHQPMRDNAKNIAITLNGEIYNYKELRKDLEALGHVFSTHSDTEVILKAYIQYGEDCPKYLNGMFAFVIWNEDTQELFMARDRFGEKPLFYAYDKDENLVIASEIKALAELGIPTNIDPVAIDLYLTLMCMPPWRTMYKDIHTLLPAHHGVYANRALTISRYWELVAKPLSVSYDNAKAEVKRLLLQAVKKRMLAADVEIGSLLSGGVDSTIVTAYAQQFVNHPIKTFALGYGDYINELPFAAEAAKKIGTDHYTLQTSSAITDELKKVLSYIDEPHGDSADVPQHLISGLARSKVKVALGGDGGDELFLGYGWYFSYWNTRKITRLYNALFSNQFAAHLRAISVFSPRERKALLKNPSIVGTERIDKLVADVPGSGVQKINLFDITTFLPGLLLTKVDQMSMMHSLELRAPFLDYELAEYVFNLPQEYKMNHTTGKLILKDILTEIMPRSFVDRKKQGFGAPVRMWLNEAPIRTFVEATLAPGARIYDFVKEDAVRALITTTYSGKNPLAYNQVWVLMCLELWLKAHPHAVV